LNTVAVLQQSCVQFSDQPADFIHIDDTLVNSRGIPISTSPHFTFASLREENTRDAEITATVNTKITI
jgi:hypothetical protein